jgi:hypothetical protein
LSFARNANLRSALVGRFSLHRIDALCKNRAGNQADNGA